MELNFIVVNDNFSSDNDSFVFQFSGKGYYLSYLKQQSMSVLHFIRIRSVAKNKQMVSSLTG